jgi:pimeloyl-ACP methyl ester carboxylesterase
LRCHYYEWNRDGEAATILLHGIGCTGAFWAPPARYIPDRYRLIAPDLRGHGRTSKPAGGYDLDTISSDLDDLMGVLGLGSADEKPITLIGHSWGAYVAVHYASKSPLRVGRLVLVDGAIGDDKSMSWISSKEESLKMAETPTEFLESIHGYRKGLRKMLGFWNRDLSNALDTALVVDPLSGKVRERTSTKVGKSILAELWDYRVSSDIPKLVKVPVLLMLAETRRTGPWRLVRRWKKESVSMWKNNVVNFKVASFPDTCHYIPQQRPREFARVLREFVEHS